MTTKSVRVAVVEDEDLLRGLLGEWLAREPGLLLYKSFHSFASFVEAKSNWDDIDILIVDVRLPDGDGVELARTFQESRPTLVPVVVISGRPSAELLGRISETLVGSWAYLLKNSNGLGNLRKAIDAVQDGFVMVDPQAQGTLRVPGYLQVLTEPEQSVMQLVASGESNASVAKHLFISEKSVERLLTTVYQKYGLEGSSKVTNPRVAATLRFLGLAAELPVN